MTRTFIAVDLGNEARAALGREVARLRRALPGIRWADPASIHLTLSFLGELDDARLLGAMAAASDASVRLRPFTLELAGFGTFGPPRAPRVVWVGVGGQTRALHAAYGRLARALEARGFPPEERPFSPHLTLARLPERPGPGDVQRLQEALRAGGRIKAPFEVTALSVMKSELLRSGARYTRLRECVFGGAGDGDGDGDGEEDEGS